MVNNWLKNVQAWWAPTTCLLCGEPAPAGRGLCLACEHACPRLIPACPQCGAGSASAELPCGACQQHPPAFTRAVALFAYAPPVDRLILGLKFHDQLHVARTLGELLALHVAGLDPRPDVLMPVPLHISRLRDRGYNQALELARPIARHLDLPLDHRGVVRTRATAPQLGLAPTQRLRNVRAAFAVTRPVRGLHIALVDDVMTTGSTVNALATCLLKGGAAAVDVWVAARA
jgi:ComF family protein